MLIPRFKIGDIVTAVAFTDCFGNYRPMIKNLIVEKVILCKCPSMPNGGHIRIMATSKNPYKRVEGAEGFFSA